MKIRDGQGKWLLRQLLYKYVPRALIERPKKGFSIPLDRWLRGPLREWAEFLLDAKRLRGEAYLNPAPIRKKWEEHLSGGRNWHGWLWGVLMFQAWLESHHHLRAPEGVHSLKSTQAGQARYSCFLQTGTSKD
jgi:asparagine synthase (glutamine-hydrolysing)